MAPISLRKGAVDKLAGELVKSVTGLEENTKNYDVAMQYALSNFRFHRFLDVNPLDVRRKLDGVSKKLIIHSQHSKAESLQSLLQKYLLTPFSSTLDSTETDVHFSLLSVLLNLSDSPIHHEYKPEEKKKDKEEETFDWTSYLLASEEKLALGVPTDPLIMVALDDSDDEFQLEMESESLEDSTGQRDSGRKSGSVGGQTWTTAIEKSYAAIDGQDYEWLEEHIIPSYWKLFHLPEPGLSNVPSVSGLCSVAYNWEIYKRENESYPATPFGKLLTEKQIVRETLWALQGASDLFVYKLIDKKLYVTENVLLSHMTKETLQSLLQYFADYATIVHLLKAFISDCVVATSKHSKTFRAFGSALAVFMKIRTKKLNKIEEQMIKSEKAWTLAALKIELALDSSVMLNPRYLLTRIWNHVKIGTLAGKVVRIDMERIKKRYPCLYEYLETLAHQVTCLFHLYKTGVMQTMRSIDTTPEQVMTFLDVFYELICSFDTLGLAATGKLSVLLPIFVQTIKPHLQDVDDWMMYGKLPAREKNEFFIYRLENFGQKDTHYWQKTFQLRVSGGEKTQEKRISVAKFLLPVVSQVLLAGKSLGLLQDFGKLISDDLSKSVNLHEEFLKSLCGLCNITPPVKTPNENDCKSKEMASTHRKSRNEDGSPFLALNNELLTMKMCEGSNTLLTQDTETLLESFESLKGGEVCQAPVSLVIGQSLYPFIHNRYEKASSLLLNLLKNEFGLLDHLRKLQEFLLLGAGDAMRLFYHDIFQKARFNGFWQDVSYLNIVLQDAVQVHYPDMIGRLTVGLRAMSDSRRTVPQVQALDSLSLHYEVPWPMTIIFDSETEGRYNVIFRFLLQVKRALWSLEQLRFNDLVANTEQGGQISNVEMARVRHQMFLFRMRLLHFIQGLHHYIMTRILHSTRLELEKELRRVKDLDEILVIHNDYLEKIFDRCLLNQKVGFAKEAVIRILNVALELQAKWDVGINRNSEEQVEALESEFSKCTKYLLSFLKNLVKRGSFPHLEMLSVALK